MSSLLHLPMEEAKKETWNKYDQLPVLMFSAGKILTAIFASKCAAAKVFSCNTQNITMACSGATMSTKGFYWRNLVPTVLVQTSDIGKLTLDNYDSACGVDRKTYKTSHMTRVGTKYNTKKRVANHERYVQRKEKEMLKKG